MRLLELLEKRAQANESGFLTKEAQENIVGTTMQKTAEYIEMKQIQEELQKEAQEIIENLPEEYMEKAAAHIEYGKAYARGMQAGLESAIDSNYGTILNKIAEVHGIKVAEEIDASLREAGGEEVPSEEDLVVIEEVVDTARDAAAEELIEAAGGEEVVSQNPEVAEEIAEAAEVIGDQVAEEIMDPEAQETE